MQRPLAGTVVVDLSQNVAGPFGTMILGDLGATVIKIERPDRGDDTRQWASVVNGESTSFLGLNRNKKSVAVNIRHPAGREIVEKLAAKADVFVESMRPGKIEEIGLGWKKLSQLNPKLIYVSLSAFGRTGPMGGRPGYDTLLQAYSGIMEITGTPEGEPVRVGTPLIDLGTGMWLAIGTLAAIITQKLTGRGQRVQPSLLQTAVGYLPHQIAEYTVTGKMPPGKLGTAAYAVAPYQAFKAKDGYIVIGALNDGLYRRICQVLQRPELAEDPRFKTNSLRVENQKQLETLFNEALQARTVEEWLQAFEEAGVPATPIQNIAQIAQDKQVRHLGLVRPLPHPKIPHLEVVGLPVTFPDMEPREDTPAPLLGQHTLEVLTGLGYDEPALRRLESEGVVRLGA